jgi:hypothetical protein
VQHPAYIMNKIRLPARQWGLLVCKNRRDRRLDPGGKPQRTWSLETREGYEHEGLQHWDILRQRSELHGAGRADFGISQSPARPGQAIIHNQSGSIRLMGLLGEESGDRRQLRCKGRPGHLRW